MLNLSVVTACCLLLMSAIAAQPCFRLYRADVLQVWTAPAGSVLCNKELLVSNPLISNFKSGSSVAPGFWVIDKSGVQRSIDEYWITEDPTSKDFSIFVGDHDGYHVFLSFRFATSKELVGLVTVEKSAMKSTIRSIIYISANDLSICKSSFTVLIHFILLIVAGVLYMCSFFHPLAFFSSVFIPVFYVSLSVYHGTTEILSNSSIIWSVVICLFVGLLPGAANLKLKSNIVSLTCLSGMVVFCFYGAGSTCGFLFVGSFILYLVLAVSNHPTSNDASEPYTWKSWIRRNISLGMMGLGTTIYACTSWDDQPSTLYLRWKYLDYFKHCWTETEVFRSMAIGIIFSVITGIVLTFRLRRKQDIAQDPWEHDFLRWLMDPSFSRHGPDEFLHESLAPMNDTILGEVYMPDNVPSHPPELFSATGDRGSVNRMSLSVVQEEYYRNGKSMPNH